MVAAIVDAGPLVAYLDVAETHHFWAIEQIKILDSPLLVCEPVLTEVLHILKRRPAAQAMVFELVEEGTLLVAFHIEDHIAALRRLHRKYGDIPMSLADACIVRMAEIHERHLVFTLDSDFTFYRKHGRVPLELLRPQ
jgi:predicted nucleic acid-binding protein